MIIVILVSKIASKFLRLFKLGGGTSLPGLVIEKYFMHYLTRITSQYKKVALITGTNGKTTTQSFLRHILESSGLKVVSNLSGANLIRGIASVLISDCSIFGKVRSDIAVFEVEEATMPILLKLVRPHFIVVTNLFRDQLDAYGEVVKTRECILNAIKEARSAKVILNGDDINVRSISQEIRNKVILFQIKDKRIKEIFYERGYFKHEVRKGTQEIYAKSITVSNDLSTRFNIYGLKEVVRDVHFKSPGLQNVYNALAAVTVSSEIKSLKAEDLRLAFSRFSPAFGRGEIIKTNGKQIRLLLIKNPASFTANLNMLKHILNLKLLIIINDKIADGRDVSWLWDAKLELLEKANIAWITVSGTRANDMLLRLKYAQVQSMCVEIEPNIARALDISLSKLRDGETLFILPTYTAMLAVRKVIGSIVKIREFWR